METAAPATCQACGAIASPADSYCEACGRELGTAAVGVRSVASAVCRNCDSPRISTDGYCEQCGHKARAARDHIEIDVGVAVGVTDRGVRHHRNEDAMALAVIETPAIRAVAAVVCDGVSTSDRADEASLAAADKAATVLAAALRAGAAAEEALLEAAAAADAAVRELAEQSENAPAATYMSAVVSSETIWFCWAGDSRAYWLPTGAIDAAKQLTRDDSLAEELVATGVPGTDVVASPHGHIVTRWLGADAEPVAPHTGRFEPQGPGILLVCSDGLWNYQPDAAELHRMVLPMGVADLPGAAAHLLAFALKAGGHDNVTIVLVAFPPVMPRR